jgi:hypothetical protein
MFNGDDTAVVEHQVQFVGAYLNNFQAWLLGQKELQVL